MYYIGKDSSGVLMDFQTKAQQGDVVSMINVGNLCAWGCGIQCNEEMAIEYYIKAIRAGWDNDDLLSLLKKGGFTEDRLAELLLSKK